MGWGDKKYAAGERRISFWSRLVLQTSFMLVVFLPGAVSVYAQKTSAEPLLQVIDLALLQSDTALDLRDTAALGRMDTAAAEHNFDTKIVPLTSVGFTEGTGTQQLGLELQKEVSSGATLRYGFLGTSYSDDTSYVLTNQANARAYVKLSQGLFRRWGRKYNLSRLNVAQLQEKQQQISSERSLQSLILATVQMYYELVLARQLESQYEKALDRSREHLSAAKDRQSVGLVSKADVYRAELAVLTAEDSVDQQKRSVQRAHDQLYDTLCVPEGEDVVIVDTVRRMVPVIPDDWSEDIYNTRLDWQAQRVEHQINKLEMYYAERNLSPDVGLSFVVEQMGEGEDADEVLAFDETNWAIQLEMLSSLDSFDEESALARKKIEQARLSRKTEALRRQIKREARDGFLDLVSTEKALILSRKRLQQAEMALDLAKIRYEKGLSDNLEILDAEEAYSSAEIDISRGLTAYNVAAVKLANNLGVLDRQWVEMSFADEETATAGGDGRHE